MDSSSGLTVSDELIIEVIIACELSVSTDDQNVRVFVENGVDYEIGGVRFNGTSCRWRADNMR